MTLWLVLGDPDPFAGGQQRADHPGAGVGLARSRWPLDGEHRQVECEGHSARCVERWLPIFNERRPVGLPDARTPSEQQVARRPMGP